jgi:hypothetical protein
MAILSLEDYKKYNPSIGDNVDDRLNVVIPSAERYFLMRIGNRDIEETEKEEYYDGDGTVELLLKRYPVTSITELKIDDTIVDATNYVLYPDEAMIKTINGYAFVKTNYRNVYVKYKAGYEVGNIPLEIVMAIAELVTRKIESFDKEKGGAFSSEAFIGGSMVFKEEDETEYVKNIIDYYHKKGPKVVT